ARQASRGLRDVGLDGGARRAARGTPYAGADRRDARMPGEGRGGPAQGAGGHRGRAPAAGRRMTADLVRRTVALCRDLRGRGMMVTTAHAIDAIRALRCVGLESRGGAYLALRWVFVARPEGVGILEDPFAMVLARLSAPAG